MCIYICVCVRACVRVFMPISMYVCTNVSAGHEGVSSLYC
jgi:hypothetical protein